MTAEKATKKTAKRQSGKTSAKSAAKKVRSVTKRAAADNSKGTVHAFEPRQSRNDSEMAADQMKQQFEGFAQNATAAPGEKFDAMMKSGNIAMRGFEGLMKTCLELMQTSAERNARAMQTLIACKSLNELTETQSRLAQQGFDDFMAGATKLSEIGARLATDAFAPINDQITRTMKKTANAA